MDGSSRSSSDLHLHGRSRRAHTIQTTKRVWLRHPILESANKFNSRCTEARLLGFCLKSSRYILVDFDGRFRMVRTIKRANADDKWKVVSAKDPFSAAEMELTPAEFTCSRGTRGEVNPAAQRLERHPVDALPPDPDHEPVSRRVYLKQRDFMAHGTSDRCPGCRALIGGGRAQGHTEECRIRVEGVLRKTEEGKACLRAAASRLGDTLTGRALKRVRFAEDQGDNNAEVPEIPHQTQRHGTFPLRPRHPALRSHLHSILHYLRLQLKCLTK